MINPPQRRRGIDASTEERFWTKVQERSSGCWEWQAYCNSAGYGRFHHDDRLGYAHRWAYEAYVGPIPPGHTVDHLCRNHRCVNPDHLDAVSQLENNRRGADRESERGQVTTTCIRGHEKTPENVYRYGTRYHCKICRRLETAGRLARDRDRINARRRQRYAQRKAEAAVPKT